MYTHIYVTLPLLIFIHSTKTAVSWEFETLFIWSVLKEVPHCFLGKPALCSLHNNLEGRTVIVSNKWEAQAGQIAQEV
jgi:hypothetical protein